LDREKTHFPMDPIDQMACRYLAYCRDSLTLYAGIQEYLDRCNTTQDAFKELTKADLILFVNTEHPERIGQGMANFRRCMEFLDDIVALAKKVFILNFYESDARMVFHKEVSFSYACKMLAHYGPMLHHFSPGTTSADVIQAELSLAWNTPSAALGCESDLLCLEGMPTAAEAALDDLMCHESMPLVHAEYVDAAESPSDDFGCEWSPEPEACFLDLN
jgi:hypothetical protein